MMFSDFTVEASAVPGFIIVPSSQTGPLNSTALNPKSVLEPQTKAVLPFILNVI